MMEDYVTVRKSDLPYTALWLIGIHQINTGDSHGGPGERRYRVPGTKLACNL
jgi:hypothetical protein